jgi:hypothetical protein
MDMHLLHTLHIPQIHSELALLLKSDFNQLTGSFKALRKRLFPVVSQMKELYIYPKHTSGLACLTPTKFLKPGVSTPSTCTPSDTGRVSSCTKSTKTVSRSNSSSTVKRKLKLTPRQSPCKPSVLNKVKNLLPPTGNSKKNSDSDSSLDLDFDPRLEFPDQAVGVDPDKIFNLERSSIKVDLGKIFRGLSEDDSRGT